MPPMSVGQSRRFGRLVGGHLLGLLQHLVVFKSTKYLENILRRESSTVTKQSLQSVRAEGDLQRAAELRIDHGHQGGGFHEADLVRVGLHLYRADEVVVVVLEPAR